MKLDPIEAQVEHERAWAYARWLEHLSWNSMRQRAAWDPEAGGLGYDLSEQALRGLVAGAREAMGELSLTRADMIEREAHDLDQQQRNAAALAQAAAVALREAGSDGTLDHNAAKLMLDADAKARAIGESRRKLLGLDASERVVVDLQVQDAATAELNAMLEAAGLPAVTT